jgi:hypothetical protein
MLMLPSPVCDNTYRYEQILVHSLIKNVRSINYNMSYWWNIWNDACESQ